MKLVKSLLLGSAAGLLAVATSQAADLPYRKAAPVAYVKICDAYGAGYFYIPGSDTCLRVGGNVTFEYEYAGIDSYTFAGRRFTSNTRNTTGDYARARLTLDSRTATGYGTLRAVGSIDVNYKNGVETGANGYSVDFDKAFIQWAGITAGNLQTFFSFYADQFGYRDTIGADANRNLLGYTATFGGGFSASISLESNPMNVTGYLNTNGGAAANIYNVPDIVGQVNLTQGWGSAQISGAAHEQKVGYTNVGGGTSVNTTWGYAGLAGVNIKLPSLAAGDSIWLEGSAGKGALQYAYSGVSGRYYNAASPLAAQAALTGFANTFGDFDGIILGNSQRLPSWYHVTAAFQHYFSPQVDAELFGSYINIKYPGAALAATAATSSWNEFDVGGVLQYHPVAGLTFGVEIIYSKLHNNVSALNTAFAAANNGALGYTSDIDTFTGTLHIERDF